ALDSVSVTIEEDEFSAEKINLKKMGYGAFLFKDKVEIAELSVKKPVIKLQQNKPEKEEVSDEGGSFNKEVNVKKVSIAQADLTLLNGEHEQLRLKNYTLKMNEIKLTEDSVKRKI